VATDPSMRLFLTYVLLGMPALGIVSYYRVKSGKPLPAKLQRYRAVIVLQIFLILLTILTARANSIRLFGPVWPSAWAWVLAAAYMVLIALKLKSGFRKLSDQRMQRTRILLPEDSVQFRFWIVISLLAGLSEECAYRGLAYVAVSQQAGSRALAVGICTAAFGIAHMLQGWRGVLGTTLIALVFHGLVYLTQGLYLPIVIHIVYDLVVGYFAMMVLMQDSQSRAKPAQAGS
jgi:membrane protease YdiL (CAAX protease family)